MNPKIVNIVYIAVLVLTLGLLVSSAGVTYWYKARHSDVHVGLFQVCKGDDCQIVLNAVSGWCEEKFRASQGFIIISCIVVGVLTIFSILRTIVDQLTFFPPMFVDLIRSVPPIAELVVAVALSVCVIIPWTIAADIKRVCVCAGDSCHFHVSFAFCVIAWFITLLLPVWIWFTKIRAGGATGDDHVHPHEPDQHVPSGEDNVHPHQPDQHVPSS